MFSSIIVFAILIILLAVLSSAMVVVWTAIHEYSHLIAVKLTCGLTSWNIKILPHYLDGVKVGGSLTWMPKREITPLESVIISLAPCALSFVSIILFPIAIVGNNFVITMFCYFGIFDLMGNASCTGHYNNDFNSAARSLGISSWKLSLPAIIVGALSAITGIIILIFKCIG